MKKLLGILVLGLLLSGNAYAVKLSCTDNKKWDINSPSDSKGVSDLNIIYHAIDLIIDPNGSVHITEYSKWVPWTEIFNKKYKEDKAKIESKKDKAEFANNQYYNYNPLIKEKKNGNERFTSLDLKAGHKIKTKVELRKKPSVTDIQFTWWYEVDLKENTVKAFWGVTAESAAMWNANWTEKDDEAGFKKIGEPVLQESYINCITDTIDSTEGGVASSGSGFFINNKGYFITNNHVVKGCKQSKINFKEEEVDAELIATDETLDLALLKAKVKPKDYLDISDDPPEKMQRIFVAGYPFGKGLSDDLKFTQGIISAVKGYADNSNQIQLDAAINSGNSGGPIVNEDGDLVAVAVSGLDKSKSEGIGFGIKASSVKNFLEVNNVKYSSSSLINFGMNNKKLNKLMEASTVYTFCN